MANADLKSDDTFKLPRSSLDEVFKVVQGYSTIEDPASLGDVSKKTGMHQTSISGNVGFLLSLGIIEGGQSKVPTEVGRQLGRALMHNVQDEVVRILGDLVADNEFLKSVLAAVRIRKGMDESSLRAHIAYSAGRSKTGSTTVGTGTVVDLLKRSGQLKSEDGKLIVSTLSARSSDSEPAALDKREHAFLQAESPTPDPTSPFAISIKIELRCEPADLDDLGAKLRKVVDDYSRGTRTTDHDEE